MPLLSRYSRDPNYTAVRRIARHQITLTSLAILDAIYRYRYITTSQIFRLLSDRDQRNLYYHLQALFHKHKLVNRLTLFSASGWPEEFVYFLDSPQPLELLCEYGVRRASELDYDRLAHGAGETSEGRMLFVRHELMISRLRLMLELASRQSNGAVELSDFRQGAELHSSVTTKALANRFTTIAGKRTKILYETSDKETIPHRPDAFFTLRFPKRPEGKQEASFFYEADRQTMDTSRMVKKLRGHFHFIVKQKLHQSRYNVASIRAVLIETTSMEWAENLRHAATHPLISGYKPSNLFWFAPSELFAKPAQSAAKEKSVPYYYLNPSVIFNPVWFSPNDRAGNCGRSLTDS